MEIHIRYIGKNKPPFTAMAAGNFSVYWLTLYKLIFPMSGGNSEICALSGTLIVRRKVISRLSSQGPLMQTTSLSRWQVSSSIGMAMKNSLVSWTGRIWRSEFSGEELVLSLYSTEMLNRFYASMAVLGRDVNTRQIGRSLSMQDNASALSHSKCVGFSSHPD